LYFALAVTTSLSIGSKSLLISQMVVILFTLRAGSSTQAGPQIPNVRPLRPPASCFIEEATRRRERHVSRQDRAGHRRWNRHRSGSGEDAGRCGLDDGAGWAPAGAARRNR